MKELLFGLFLCGLIVGPFAYVLTKQENEFQRWLRDEERK